MNWLDRAITYFAPGWGYRRLAFRAAAEEMARAYDAADGSRRNARWAPFNQTAEQADRPWRDRLRARSRDLEQNSDIEGSIVRAFERNVVGLGFTLQAHVGLKNGTGEDEALNRDIETLWKRWCLPRNCDVSMQQSLAELCRMAIRRTVVDGGMLFVKNYTPGGPVPFCLQAREVDDLAPTAFYWAENGNLIVGGIELNEWNQPVAYHLRTVRPDGFTTGDYQRVEAQRVIFLWDRRRPSQVREITRLAPTLERLRDIEEYMESVSVKERVAACFAMFIERVNPAVGAIGRGVAGNKPADASSGYAKQTLTPGMIYEGQPGETAKAITPPASGSSARDFVALQQRLAGSGQGLSYEATSRDMSQVNYSSARQGLLEDQGEYRLLQQWLVEHFLEEVYSEFVISGVLSGALSMPKFWDDKYRYLGHEFIAPGWSWIDPLKEVKANGEALATGQTTLMQVCAEQGLDWREVLAQRKKELDEAKRLGVPLAPAAAAIGSADKAPDVTKPAASGG